MHSVTATSQFFAVVGSAQISEHHSDEIHRYFVLPERHGFAVDFAKMLQALRAALSLR